MLNPVIEDHKSNVDKIVSTLNKDQLRKLASLQLEIDRRKSEEKIRYYKPFDYPGGQLDFHRSTTKTKIVVAPNRSGKTTADVAEVDWQARGVHPYRKTPKPPVRIRVCCTDFLNGIEKIMIPKFQEFVKRDDLRGGSWATAYSKEQRTLYYKNGSFVEFMSYDQDVEKFGGTSRHLIVEDEACPLDIHNENMARLVDVNGELLMTLTPINLNARTSWVYDLWLEAKEGKSSDLGWFFFDIYKNTALSKEYIDKFVASIRDEGERIARIEGKFPQLAGLVHKGFSRTKHRISPIAIPEHWTRYIGIDPHTREKTAVLFVAVDPEENYYIYDEIFEEGTGKILVDIIKTKIGRDKIQKTIMDNSAKDPNKILGRSIWQEFVDPDRNNTNTGIFATTVKHREKDINVGVRMINDLLGLDEVYQKPRVFIFDTCPGIIREFETCIWDDYKDKYNRPPKEKIRKKGIHRLDCFRYILMSGAPYVKLRMPQEDEYRSPYGFLNKYQRAEVRVN